MDGMAEERTRLLAALWAFMLMVSCSNAVITVENGERIQDAIDSAPSGETIEVQGGVYKESIVLDRSIVLKGISSESGLPRVESEEGAAITISESGVVLDGFWAKSRSGWTADAGILVLSNDNIIRSCMASGSGNIGILLLEAENNTIFGNAVQANGREGMLLRNSSRNIIQSNEFADNRYGLTLEGSGGNRIMA
ncbi:MAG: right-handed parallel beta-helix repeat-containing protein, partial [Methanothrix sp.]